MLEPCESEPKSNRSEKTAEAVGKLQRVLQNLLFERVPIRDLRTILEVLSEHSRIDDVEVLSEYVRTALRRSICNALLKEAPDNAIAIYIAAGPMKKRCPFSGG